jgi:flagellin-like protein
LRTTNISHADQMEGISGIIAAILMMMVVVSLAGTAYFWLSGMSGTMKDSAKSATNGAGDTMNTEFRVESARNITPTTVRIMIRNTGNAAINASKIGAFLDGYMLGNSAPGNLVIQHGGMALINLTGAVSPFGKTLRLVSDRGFEVTTTIT